MVIVRGRATGLHYGREGDDAVRLGRGSTAWAPATTVDRPAVENEDIAGIGSHRPWGPAAGREPERGSRIIGGACDIHGREGAQGNAGVVPRHVAVPGLWHTGSHADVAHRAQSEAPPTLVGLRQREHVAGPPQGMGQVVLAMWGNAADACVHHLAVGWVAPAANRQMGIEDSVPAQACAGTVALHPPQGAWRSRAGQEQAIWRHVVEPRRPALEGK